jgi:hypothetical protein
MLKNAIAAAGLGLLIGAGAAMAQTAEPPIVIQPTQNPAEAMTPAAVENGIAPVRPGAATKAAGEGGGCGYSARTAYLGS